MGQIFDRKCIFLKHFKEYQGAVAMKEGSFQTEMSGIDFTGGPGEEWKLEKVPLPNQVPAGLDFSQIPQSIIKSGVVDALISQNDDLMSRLGVAIRRVASLEEKLSDSRLETERYRSQYDNLNDQLLVLKEKSRSLYERKDREEGEYTDLQDQVRLLEIRYGELYAQSQNKEALLLKQFEKETKELNRLKRYRARVARAAEGLKKAAHEKWQAEVKFAQSEKTQESLRTSLNESAQYIQEITKEHKLHSQKLIEQYETRITEFKTKLAEVVQQNENLGEKVHTFDALIEEKMRIENQVVLLERREQEEKVRTSAEISDLQKALARYRNEAKELAIELETTTTEFQAAQTELAQTATDKKALEEQVDNLQVLWRNQQLQIEKSQEKVNSLQKLNQELSIAINQYRRDIRELKQSADTDAHGL
jgi:chromosome segregation ATPase